MRRFTMKLENHCYSIALHFVDYNFAKIIITPVTPAMEPKLTKNQQQRNKVVHDKK